jgi:hypothetical protein
LEEQKGNHVRMLGVKKEDIRWGQQMGRARMQEERPWSWIHLAQRQESDH